MNVQDYKLFDNGAPFTRYYQLREHMAQKIASREWKPGQKIPSETELCEIYGVSRITVRKAVEDLVRLGRLIKQQGKGTFVTNVSMEHKLTKFYSFSEELKQSGMTENVQVLSFVVDTATEIVREKLSLQQQAQVFILKRLRMANEMPYTVEFSHIPYSMCPNLTGESIAENGLYNSMRALNVYPERIVEKLRAIAVGKTDASLMKIKPNSPAILLERLTYFGTDPIEYCVSTVRGDFFTYTFELQ